MNPSKILCVHLNYSSRVEEFGARLPKAPTYFLKPPSALIRSGEPVVRPRGCRYLNFEGEIVAVIGSNCRGIEPEDAGRFVAGYTIGNDFGLHDFRDTDAGSMLRVKGSDTMCPVLDEVVSGWDFRGKTIRTLVNGEVRQSGNTDEMAWNPHYLVADLARTHTLFPGTWSSRAPRPARGRWSGRRGRRRGGGTRPSREPGGRRRVGDSAGYGAQPTESEEVRSTALGGDWEFRGIRPPRAAAR